MYNDLNLFDEFELSLENAIKVWLYGKKNYKLCTEQKYESK